MRVRQTTVCHLCNNSLAEQCLDGAILSIWWTSSVVTGSNSDRRDVEVCVLSTGAGALAVAARIELTLSSNMSN